MFNRKQFSSSAVQHVYIGTVVWVCSSKCKIVIAYVQKGLPVKYLLIIFTTDCQRHTGNPMAVARSYCYELLSALTHIYHSTGGMAILEVNVFSIDVRNVSVICMFQPGFTCTIDYGTNSSYSNLNYSNSNNSTQNQTTIVLSQGIQDSTTYYYIASAESSSQCERVRGTFRTGLVYIYTVMLQYFACTFVDFVNACKEVTQSV